MPTSNFKLFDENKANMLSDSEYNSNAQRLNGVQSGVASSQLQNKFQYQASLMAYAIAQLMVQNGYDATDTTAVTTFISNLSNTMLQKVADKANETQAKAGTDNTKWMTPSLVKSAINELAPMVSDILSNETKALYGLDDSATPDDVFSWVGKYAEYWWRRRISGYVESQLPLSKVVYISQNYAQSLQLSKSITIDQSSGEVSLKTPEEFLISVQSSLSNFRAMLENLVAKAPCYITGLYGDESGIYYLPEGSTLNTTSSTSSTGKTVCFYYKDTTTNNDWLAIDADVQSVKITSKLSNGDWEFIKSTNRNEFPDSGVSDGYEYEYIGVPFEHLILPPVELVIGTYTGDGTSLRTINLGFTPKAVYIADPRGASFRYSSGVGRFCGGLALNGYAAIDSNRTIIEIVENGFVVNRDTSTSPYIGTNYDGDIYKYVAIK